MTPIEAIAHRGVRDRYPENSIPAFVAALDLGADAVELDVHATADGTVVVHHDPRLPASINSPHAGRAINSLTRDDLSSFELAPGVDVPTLEDALTTICPRARAYIEIKAPNIENLVANVIAEVPGAAGNCAVHCFDHRISKKFASLASGIPTGILLVGYPVDARAVLSFANARDFWESCEFVDKDLVETIHAAGGRIVAWTCNDPAEWRRLIELGVDGICTDRVGTLVTHLKR
jgi:glycerophosphoryl diester phosphodiesterase